MACTIALILFVLTIAATGTLIALSRHYERVGGLATGTDEQSLRNRAKFISDMALVVFVTGMFASLTATAVVQAIVGLFA